MAHNGWKYMQISIFMPYNDITDTEFTKSTAFKDSDICCQKLNNSVIFMKCLM